MEEDHKEHVKEHDKEHKKGVKQYLEHTEHKKHKSFETIAWALGIAAVILAVLFVSSLLTKGFSSSGGLSEQELKEKTLSYLNELMQGQGQTATVDSIKDEGDLYSLKINIGGRVYDSYARKDGSFLFPTGINLNQQVAQGGDGSQGTPQQTNVPKSDKPTVELFVMSHCPFGTQSEKGMLPAVRTLGDKVDFKVRFVYYAMHGKKEVDEQLNQYCIQKEQPSKYLNYLACFLNDSAGQGSPTAGAACMVSTGVDKTKLSTCVAAADSQFEITKNFNDRASWLSGQFPLFNTDKDLNTKYSVGGSPTLIINGVQSNAGRDSASYLAAICNAFNNKPAECDTQLSGVSPGPGFGYDSTAAATAAGCGV